MLDEEMVREQLEFYKKGEAGCLFAAHAARTPHKFGWAHVIVDPLAQEIDKALATSIADASISTLSLVFRESHKSPERLQSLIHEMSLCRLIWLESDELINNLHALGFRANIGNLTSWVSGFAPFEFMPLTRRSPFVEVSIRCKPRPSYKKIMKEAPPGVIHLADMDMQGMAARKFKILWKGSFTNTERRLGHKPDSLSAAKTTFVIPLKYR